MRKEGKAINNKTMAGKIVQITSIVWPWSKNRLFNSLKNKAIIKYPTNVVTKIKINKEWSWKKFNCSIIGEFLSCIPKLAHVVIVNLKKGF